MKYLLEIKGRRKFLAIEYLIRKTAGDINKIARKSKTNKGKTHKKICNII